MILPLDDHALVCVCVIGFWHTCINNKSLFMSGTNLKCHHQKERHAQFGIWIRLESVCRRRRQAIHTTDISDRPTHSIRVGKGLVYMLQTELLWKKPLFSINLGNFSQVDIWLSELPLTTFSMDVQVRRRPVCKYYSLASPYFQESCIWWCKVIYHWRQELRIVCMFT